MSTKRRTENTRTRGRQQALQILYQSDLTRDSVKFILESPSVLSDMEPLESYAEVLVQGVAEHLAEIDKRLCETSEHWALGRMAIVDKNILRIAAFEIFYRQDIPDGVAINEAVELAKKFGQDDSFKFVNGVLGKLVAPQEEEEER